MTIIDATTVSALLIVLTLAVLATVVTAGVALARIYGASRPTTPHRLPGRRTWPFPAGSSRSVTDRPRPRSRTRASGPAALHFQG